MLPLGQRNNQEPHLGLLVDEVAPSHLVVVEAALIVDVVVSVVDLEVERRRLPPMELVLPMLPRVFQRPNLPHGMPFRRQTRRTHLLRARTLTLLGEVPLMRLRLQQLRRAP